MYVLVDSFDDRLIVAPQPGDGLLTVTKWNNSEGTGDMGAIVDDLTGGRCYRLSAWSTNWWMSGLFKNFNVNKSTEVMIGGWVKFSAGGMNTNMWNFYSTELNGLAQGRLVFNASGVLQFTGNNAFTEIKSVGSYVWTADKWVWVELYYKVADVGGRFILKLTEKGIAGFPTPATVTDIDFTGDTRSSVTYDTISAVSFFGERGDLAGSKYLDDVVIRVAESNFMGPLKVRILRPTSAGDSSGLTPTPALANYKNVMDLPQDNDTTYVSGTGGAKDLYNFESLRAGDVPHYAQLVIKARGTLGGKLTAVAKTSAEILGTEKVALAAYTDMKPGYIEEYPNDPADASAWTAAKLASAQFGVKAT